MSVVEFPGVSRLDVPVDKVLEKAREQNLQTVLVIGWTADGMEYFDASCADGGEALWLIERRKMKILAAADV